VQPEPFHGPFREPSLTPRQIPRLRRFNAIALTHDMCNVPIAQTHLPHHFHQQLIFTLFRGLNVQASLEGAALHVCQRWGSTRGDGRVVSTRIMHHTFAHLWGGGASLTLALQLLLKVCDLGTQQKNRRVSFLQLRFERPNTRLQLCLPFGGGCRAVAVRRVVSRARAQHAPAHGAAATQLRARPVRWEVGRPEGAAAWGAGRESEGLRGQACHHHHAAQATAASVNRRQKSIICLHDSMSTPAVEG